MNILNEQVIHYADYVTNSPFVMKAQGKGDNALLAKDICESSAMLTTTKREHETALEVFREAAKIPEIYAQLLRSTFEYEKAELEERDRKAQEEYNNLPKKDEAYIHECSREIDHLKEQKLSQEKLLRKNIDDNYEAAMKTYKNQIKKRMIILICLVVLCVLVSILTLTSDTDALPFGISIAGFLGTPIGVAALVCIPFGIVPGISKPQKYTAEAIDNYIVQQTSRYDAQIDALKKCIEVGIDENSEFAKKLRATKAKLSAIPLQNYFKLMDLNKFLNVSANNFKDIISVLETTLENFDSINSWAANYMREYKQEQHNEKMLELEQERAQKQEESNARVEDEQRRQTEALQRQADAAEDQAREAARQAEEAARQADASEEMKRRMENERWGDVYRTDKQWPPFD